MSKFTHDHIYGSGFSTFPWYAEAAYDEETDVLTIVIDCEDERHERKLTSEDTWRAYQKLLRGGEIYFSSPESLKGEYDEIDLDAGDTDCIVQQAVIGEVVFG